MGAVASLRVMRRSGALALLAFALGATPALATDVSVTFRCCAYTPNSVRILPGEKVTIAPEAGSGLAFDDHPLHYADSVGNMPTGTVAAERSFPQAGIYQWYCGVHGSFDGTNVHGMSGRVAVTDNHLPVASFTASAQNVASGTEVTFDASGSSDADLAQYLNYRWDLDGDGADDPGQTSVNPSAVFTNTGTTPRAVTVRLTATDTNGDAVGPESTTRSMVITVQPAPGSTTPPPPGGGPPPTDSTPPVVKLALARKLTIARTLKLSFTTSESTSMAVTLKVGRRTAKARRDFAAAGRHTLTLKLSKALRRVLRHRRTATLTLVATDDAGNGTTLRRTLKLEAR
jgi:PKD repeat protein